MTEEEMKRLVTLAIADADRKGAMLVSSLVSNLILFILLLFALTDLI